MRWGIVGASTIAREWMVGAIQATGGEVAAVLSHDLGRAEMFALDFKIPKSFADPTKFFDSGLDAIYVGSTNEHHHLVTLEAASRGIHVLCEKPLSTNLSDVRAMIDACKHADVVLATNHHLRNAPTHKAMRDMIRAGAIGDIIAVRVFQAFFLPEHLQTWRINNPAAGAGVILDIAVHDVDTLRYHLRADPIAVKATTQNAGMAAPGIEDGVMAIWEFPGGVIAQTHDSFSTRDAHTGIEFLGSKGSIAGTDVMAQGGGGFMELRVGGVRTPILYTPRNLYEIGVEKFVAATRGEREPAASGEDGYISLACALACAEAARTGLRVEIPSALR
jgi:1,5-anhydro-D-fructose reductase (1,5-anhydro-D-mannitol-forming)